MRRSHYAFLIAAGAFAFFVLSVTGPSLQVSQANAVMNKNLQIGIALAKMCRLYAFDHGGESPTDLPELLRAQNETERSELLRYRDPKSGQSHEWLYFHFPAKDLAAPRGDNLLLASPIADERGRRIVVFANCSGKVVSGSEFAEIWHSANR